MPTRNATPEEAAEVLATLNEMFGRNQAELVMDWECPMGDLRTAIIWEGGPEGWDQELAGDQWTSQKRLNESTSITRWFTRWGDVWVEPYSCWAVSIYAETD